LFVCINSLSYQWTTTGAVNASVSGAQMLNRLSSQISHETFFAIIKQDVYTISIHHFHYCVSPFTTLIRCCTVALRNLCKLYPNDVTQFDITGVRRCFTATLLQPRTGTMLIKSARTRDSRVRDCVLKWRRLRLTKLKNPLLQLNQEAVKRFRVPVCGTG